MSLDSTKVTETSPGVFEWLDLSGEPVKMTAEEIAKEAKAANEAPHVGVYRWTREDGTFRG